MKLVDIGVNFHSPQLRNLGNDLVARAAAAGVTNILATGTSLSASRAALVFAQAQPSVWATAGVHPHSAKDWRATSAEEFAPLWADKRVVAVGECGLDYNRMFSPKEAQRSAFQAQIDAGLRTGKPLFLHCRDAFDDFRAMLRDAAGAGARGVVHCFTDGPAEAEAFLALGFDIGITGWVTDKARGEALRRALRAIPLSRMHLETDAPYLRPKNAKAGQQYNEPALLPYVAKAVAELKGVEVARVASTTAANSMRMFGLDPSVAV